MSNFDPIADVKLRKLLEHMEVAVADIEAARSNINANTNSAIANAGGGAKPWVSGGTVKQWDSVISLIDGEVYRRTTATGAGAVDPADDATNYKAVSYTRVTSLTNSAGGNNGMGYTEYFANGAKKIAVTAGQNVRSLVLDVTGAGVLKYLGAMCGPSAISIRVEVVMDGRVVYDNTFGGTAADYMVMVGAPGFANVSNTSCGAWYAIPEDGVDFKRSLKVFCTPVGGDANINTTMAYIMRGVK